MTKKTMFSIIFALVGVFGLTTVSAAHKVDICHVNSANDVLDLGGFSVSFGRVQSVSQKAVGKHLDNHGDSEAYVELTPDVRDFIEEFYAIKLPNADCYFLNI